MPPLPCDLIQRTQPSIGAEAEQRVVLQEAVYSVVHERLFHIRLVLKGFYHAACRIGNIHSTGVATHPDITLSIPQESIDSVAMQHTSLGIILAEELEGMIAIPLHGIYSSSIQSQQHSGFIHAFNGTDRQMWQTLVGIIGQRFPTVTGIE